MPGGGERNREHPFAKSGAVRLWFLGAGLGRLGHHNVKAGP